jgi:hypothetical protein
VRITRNFCHFLVDLPDLLFFRVFSVFRGPGSLEDGKKIRNIIKVPLIFLTSLFRLFPINPQRATRNRVAFTPPALKSGGEFRLKGIIEKHAQI